MRRPMALRGPGCWALALLLGACAGHSMHGDTVADGRTRSCESADPALASVITKDLLDVQSMAQDASVVFLDVRNAGEHGRGHIQARRSLNIGYFSPGWDEKIAALDRDTGYLVYCQCGGRSAEVVKRMSALGFKRIFHYREGYASYVDR